MRVRDSLSWLAYSRSKLPVHGAFFSDSCEPVSLLWLFLPLESSLPNVATLTNGVTALVSVQQSDDRAQGHVWVALDAFQLTDGIVDVVCRKSGHSLTLGLQTHDTGFLLVAACFHTLNPEAG